MPKRLLLALLFATALHAQQAGVQDLVPDRCHKRQQRPHQSAKTNTSGFYTFAFLNPGLRDSRRRQRVLRRHDIEPPTRNRRYRAGGYHS